MSITARPPLPDKWTDHDVCSSCNGQTRTVIEIRNEHSGGTTFRLCPYCADDLAAALHECGARANRTLAPLDHRPLPANWRKLSTGALESWTRANEDHDDYDDVVAELDERDHQRAANRGEMNGLAPH